jgi:hypothetical protein
MGIPAESEPHVRFEELELDLRTRELRANGRKLILQEQPFQILAATWGRPGHLVNRDELRQRLWSSETFVDFELGLNKAVNRLPEVLEDSADQPRFRDSPQSRTAPGCARAPASLCAIAERSSDGKEITFTAFDPLKGRAARSSVWMSSPAAAATYGTFPRMALVSPSSSFLAGQLVTRQQDNKSASSPWTASPRGRFVVKGWDNLQSVDWAADGKAMFVSGTTPQGSALLHVDLQGNARVLWERKGGMEPWFALAPWAVPSPDGRHWAIYDWKLSSNMQMMESTLLFIVLLEKNEHSQDDTDGSRCTDRCPRETRLESKSSRVAFVFE